MSTDATRSFQNTSSKSLSCRPGAGCVAEDVGGHAPEPRGNERVAECIFFGGRLAVVVSVSRQWRNVQDFPQMQHERSTQLVLFGNASRKTPPRFLESRRTFSAPLRVRQVKWKQQEHEALTRWLASSNTVGEGPLDLQLKCHDN